MKNDFFNKLPEIVLASTSPQRARILKELGFSFKVIQVDADEIVAPTPEETVLENAKLKASAAFHSADVPDGQTVITADTILSMKGKIYGKPGGKKKAREYLAKFSGRQVDVFTGVAAFVKGKEQGHVALDKAVIRFCPLSRQMLDWYVSTKEPLARAGGLGISLIGEIFVESLAGSYSCVAGLSKRAVLAVMAQLSGNHTYVHELLGMHRCSMNLYPFNLSS